MVIISAMEYKKIPTTKWSNFSITSGAACGTWGSKMYDGDEFWQREG